MRVDWLELSNRLFNASLNGWYQGIIITGVVALILKWTRGNAATRHALWFMTLWVVALLIPVHMLVKTPDSDSATGTFANAAIDPGDVPAPKHPALSEPQEGTFPEEDLYGIDPGEEPSSPAPAIERQLMTDPDPLARATPPPTDTLGAKLWRLAKRVSAVLAKPVSVQLGPGTGWWPWIPAAVMAGWIIMAVVQLAALACRLCQIRRGKQAGFAPGPELKGFFERIASEVRPGRDVELKITADQHSPMLLGFLHPVVLLPAGLPAREADPILRHELAHAKRRDDWANLVQNLIRAVLPLHPAVWWIGRQLSLEREIACDDVVLGQGGPAKAYALLLTELAGRLRTSVPLLAAGASNNKTQLQQRIDMILNPNRSISSRLVKARLGSVAVAAGLIAAAGLYAGPRLALAQAPAAPPAIAALPAPPVPPAPAVAPAGVATVSVTPVVNPEGLPDGVIATVAVDDKTKNHFVVAGQPYTSAAGAGTIHPVLPIPPQPPAMVAQVEPRPGRPMTTPRPVERDASLEQRLDRLEKLVESLVAQQGKPGGPNWINPSGQPKNPQELKALMEHMDHMTDMQRKRAEKEKQQAEEMKERAKQEMARSVDEAKRASKDASREWRFQGKMARGQQLEALRKQLDALEREKQRVSREIERLEQRLKQSDNSSEDEEDFSFEENDHPSKR